MSSIGVDTRLLDTQLEQLRLAAKNMQVISQRVDAVSRQLSWKISSSNQIRSILNTCRGNLERLEQHMDRLASALNETSVKYKKVELDLTTNADPISGGMLAAKESVQGVIGDAVGGLIGGSAGGLGATVAGSGPVSEGTAPESSPDDEDAGSGGIAMPHWKGGSSILAGSLAGGATVFGFSAEGSASGDVLGWNYDVSPFKSSIDGHLAYGSLAGSIGLLSGSLSGTVGKVEAKGSIGATLFDDGKFTPRLEAKAEASAAVAEAEGKAQFGSDEFNAHVKATGTLLGAEASAKAGIGVITVKDEKTGEDVRVVGAQAKVGAEAYVASGKVSGGFTLFGIKIDASVSGNVGAGAKVGGEVTASGVGFDIGAALGLGAGVSVKIDWSDFKFGWW